MALTQESLTVVSWNILQNNYPPKPLQNARWPNVAKTILEDCPTPDLISLYEVEGSATANYGFAIAEAIGLDNYQWTPYGRPADGMVMASRHDNEYETLVMDPEHDRRAAIMTTLGSMSIAGTHLSWRLSQNAMRVRQVNKLLERLMGQERAVIMGDLNCLRVQEPRRLLEAHGFQSVTATLPRRQRVTFPVTAYRNADLTAMQQLLLARGLSIDDIYVRGLEIEDRGRIEGDSDHFGLWAILKPVV